MNEFQTGRIRCVIYDCDGVLFDSFEANRRFYEDICSAFRQIPLSDEELRYAHTHTTREAIRLFFPNDRAVEDKVMERLRHADPASYVSYLTMEPHLLPTLEALGNRGIKRAINTSRSASMKPIVETFHLGLYFDLVVTAGDVTCPKPHPESMERILKEFDLKKNEAVCVGDSEVDQEAAQQAGIKFIAYKNPGIRADAFIQDHREILGILNLQERR